MPLEDTDPVKQALMRLTTYLPTMAMPIAHTLTNGHAERELKFLLAAAICADNPPPPAPRTHVCLMDKTIVGPELDLIALTRALNGTDAAHPKYWIETKCTFAQLTHENAATKLADFTLNQVAKYFELMYEFEPEADQHALERTLFKDRLLASTAYIVHYLTAIPVNIDMVFPHFYYENRFAARPNPLTAHGMHHAYIESGHLFDPSMFSVAFDAEHVPMRRLSYADSEVLTLEANPLIQAVIVKLKYRDVPSQRRMNTDDLR